MKSQRLDMIEEYVLEHKNASLDTLCEKFNVSKNTIRRDVDILLKRGSIMKVYGGVAALETPQTLPLLSYEERGGRFPEEKKEICRRAAELVAEDDTIYIDTGTTCLNLVDFIADKHCTILTNSLLIFNKAASYPNLDIISVPGRLNRKTLSFTGPDINDYLQTYNISMAFMACTGVTMKSGLTNASAEEYITKKAIAENANSMIRRRHPKGTDFSKVSAAEIAATEEWINNYPRKIFGYKSSEVMFRECLREIGLIA